MVKVIYILLFLLITPCAKLNAQDEFYNRIGWSQEQVNSYHSGDYHTIEDIGGPIHFYHLSSQLKAGYKFGSGRVIRVSLWWSGLSQEQFRETMKAINATLVQGGFSETGNSDEKELSATVELVNYNRKVSVMMIKDLGVGMGIIVIADKR